MIENGFYKIIPEYVALIHRLGGLYRDEKARPIFCCFEDNKTKGLFWLIPTSDLSHRTPEQIERIKAFCALPSRDIRASWYHIGHTNIPAIYRISSCIPVTDKYASGPYTSNGAPLFLKDKRLIEEIRRKLSMVLFSESKSPNKYEQKITTVREYLIQEMNADYQKSCDVEK